MTKFKDVLVSIVAGSEIIFSEVEEVTTRFLTNKVCIHLKDGTSIYTTEGSKLHQALVRELEDIDLTRRIERIVERKLRDTPPVRWNLECLDCGFKVTRRHVSRCCDKCGETMIVRSVKMID